MKKPTSFDGRERESNKIVTVISDHMLRKPLRVFTIKINEKQIFNQLKAKKKKVVQPQKKEQKPIILGESDTTQKKKPAQQLKAPGKSSKIPAKPAKAIIQ